MQNYVKKINNIKKLLKLKPNERTIIFIRKRKINGNNMISIIEKKIKRSSLKRALRKYQKRIDEMVEV
jgi:sensor histidine kinase regulating citrate/malate metabolism